MLEIVFTMPLVWHNLFGIRRVYVCSFLLLLALFWEYPLANVVIIFSVFAVVITTDLIAFGCFGC